MTSSGELYAVAVDPNSPSTLYTAGWQNGVFKSINGGTSWSPTALVVTNGSIVSMTGGQPLHHLGGGHLGCPALQQD